MIIAIKIENENVYIDKNFIQKFGIEKATQYNYSLINIDDRYSDCQPSDFDGIYFNTEKYYMRKETEMLIQYEEMIVNEIRKKYSLNQELAILRQKDSKFAEYQEYFNYVEQCKFKAKQFFNMV